MTIITLIATLLTPYLGPQGIGTTLYYIAKRG